MSRLHILGTDEGWKNRFNSEMEPTAPYKELGDRLKATREALELSQVDLCDIIKIEANRWNQYEKGKRKIPHPVALLLKKKLGISTDWIYDGDPSMLPMELHKRLSATL